MAEENFTVNGQPINSRNISVDNEQEASQDNLSAEGTIRTNGPSVTVDDREAVVTGSEERQNVFSDQTMSVDAPAPTSNRNYTVDGEQNASEDFSVNGDVRGATSNTLQADGDIEVGEVIEPQPEQEEAGVEEPEVETPEPEVETPEPQSSQGYTVNDQQSNSPNISINGDLGQTNDSYSVNEDSNGQTISVPENQGAANGNGDISVNNPPISNDPVISVDPQAQVNQPQPDLPQTPVKSVDELGFDKLDEEDQRKLDKLLEEIGNKYPHSLKNGFKNAFKKADIISVGSDLLMTILFGPVFSIITWLEKRKAKQEARYAARLKNAQKFNDRVLKDRNLTKEQARDYMLQDFIKTHDDKAKINAELMQTHPEIYAGLTPDANGEYSPKDQREIDARIIQLRHAELYGRTMYPQEIEGYLNEVDMIGKLPPRENFVIPNIHTNQNTNVNTNTTPDISVNSNVDPGMVINGNDNSNANPNISVNGNVNPGMTMGGNNNNNVDPNISVNGNVDPGMTMGGNNNNNVDPNISVNGNATPNVVINGNDGNGNASVNISGGTNSYAADNNVAQGNTNDVNITVTDPNYAPKQPEEKRPTYSLSEDYVRQTMTIPETQNSPVNTGDVNITVTDPNYAPKQPEEKRPTYSFTDSQMNNNVNITVTDPNYAPKQPEANQPSNTATTETITVNGQNEAGVTLSTTPMSLQDAQKDLSVMGNTEAFKSQAHDLHISVQGLQAQREQINNNQKNLDASKTITVTNKQFAAINSGRSDR